MDQLTGRGIQVLIPPDGAKRKGTRPGWNSARYAFMRRALQTRKVPVTLLMVRDAVAVGALAPPWFDAVESLARDRLPS
jgi:hypothetical protein